MTGRERDMGSGVCENCVSPAGLMPLFVLMVVFLTLQVIQILQEFDLQLLWDSYFNVLLNFFSLHLFLVAVDNGTNDYSKYLFKMSRSKRNKR